MTYEEVAAAAEELKAQGFTPTQVKIKEELGRGSYRDIAAHLKAWRDKQETAATATAEADLPAELISALAQAATKIRMQEKERHQAAVRAANIERDEIGETLATTEEELARLKDELANTRQETDKANGQLQAVKEQLATLRIRLAKAQDINTELERQMAKQQAEILNAEETKRENVTLRTENKELLSRAVRAEAIAEALTSQKGS